MTPLGYKPFCPRHINQNSVYLLKPQCHYAETIATAPPRQPTCAPSSKIANNSLAFPIKLRGPLRHISYKTSTSTLQNRPAPAKAREGSKVHAVQNTFNWNQQIETHTRPP